MKTEKINTSKNYLRMSMDELYEIARQKGVPGKSGMNKEELIHAIETYEKRTDPHSQLHTKDMEELREIAKESGVQNLWKMNKEELIENIRNKQKM